MPRIEDALLRLPVTESLLVRTVYAGDGVECASCGARFRRFAPFRGSPNRRCWSCGALERHRQIALLLLKRPGLLRPGLRVLHLAPEEPLRRLIHASGPSEYITADLDAPGVDMHFDLTAAPLADESFDVILCNHVLEHIPDDRAALREIRRMLVPGGWALVMTPILASTTIEDPSESDPQARLRRFGQEDHVRRYGWDYVERLREARLSVEVLRLEEELSPATVERHRLNNPQGFVEPMFLVG
jgi:hypothetical protein